MQALSQRLARSASLPPATLGRLTPRGRAPAVSRADAERVTGLSSLGSAPVALRLHPSLKLFGQPRAKLHDTDLTHPRPAYLELSSPGLASPRSPKPRPAHFAVQPPQRVPSLDLPHGQQLPRLLPTSAMPDSPVALCDPGDDPPEGKPAPAGAPTLACVSPLPPHSSQALATELVKTLRLDAQMAQAIGAALQQARLSQWDCLQAQALLGRLLAQQGFVAQAAQALAQLCVPAELRELTRLFNSEVGTALAHLNAALQRVAEHAALPGAAPRPRAVSAPQELRVLASLYQMLASGQDNVLPLPVAGDILLGLYTELGDRAAHTVQVLQQFRASPLGTAYLWTVRPALTQWCTAFVRETHLVEDFVAAFK
jgi:hypothetical protein